MLDVVPFGYYHLVWLALFFSSRPTGQISVGARNVPFSKMNRSYYNNNCPDLILLN